jgi:hypothetical protein
LEVLCSNPAQHSTQHQQQGATHSDSGGSRRGSNGSTSSRHGSSDIRRFCGVSELHKGALCILAAALYCGDICWDLGDVLTAADAAVGYAGAAVLSQPELLLNIVRLYSQVEQQLLSDLQQQQVLQLQATAGDPTAAALGVGGMEGIRAAPAPPAAIVHALERVTLAQLASLKPDDVAVGWMLGQAAVVPSAVRLLLQLWMQQLLVAPGALPAAATAGEPGAALSQQQQLREEVSEQQQELCRAVLAALQQQPAAMAAVLQLLHSGLDPQQQQQGQGLQAASAWLAVLTVALSTSSEQLARALSSCAQQQHSLLPQEPAAGDNDTASSCSILQQLLLGGSSSSLVAAAAGGGGRTGGLLQLTRKVLMSACTGSWASSWCSCHLLLACCNSLTAVAAAVSSGAVATLGGGGADKQEQEQWLLQQGVQQVRCAWLLVPAFGWTLHNPEPLGVAVYAQHTALSAAGSVPAARLAPLGSTCMLYMLADSM